LARAVLVDPAVEVFADEVKIGELDLSREGRFATAFSLPPEVVERASFDVRFVARDYVYDPQDIRRCVVFRLHLVEAAR
jgi:hypothetical protein